MTPFPKLCAVGLIFAALLSCAPLRRPIPPGEIPAQYHLSQADELYGHEVLNQLTQRYPLDRDDARIKRVRNIVDHLTSSANLAHNPWHVYVLSGDTFENAAATRGNYIFVWTGMLNTVQNDEELAVCLAHEIAHVLAGHTKPTPQEEVNATLAGALGSVAREVTAGQGGAWVLASDLAGLLMQEAIKAMLLNPEHRRQELEADQIGLFLLAEGGYDPQIAVDFWERMKQRPGFSGFPLQFMSTHPSSSDRISALKKILPQAKERFETRQGRRLPQTAGSGSEWAWNEDASRTPGAAPLKQDPATDDSFSMDSQEEFVSKGPQYELHSSSWAGKENVWVVYDDEIKVYARPDTRASVVSTLVRSTHVVVESMLPERPERGRWLHITNPVTGYVLSPALAPLSE